MKTYIGTKTIKAIPMNRLEYNQYRGWELPSNENGEDEGLLVEYIDGGKSNDLRHEGYISWSPKEPFNKAYSNIELPIYYNDLLSHEQRVVIERLELEIKYNKLCIFIESDIFKTLDDIDCVDLKIQSADMYSYLCTLLRRESRMAVNRLLNKR